MNSQVLINLHLTCFFKASISLVALAKGPGSFFGISIAFVCACDSFYSVLSAITQHTMMSGACTRKHAEEFIFPFLIVSFYYAEEIDFLLQIKEILISQNVFSSVTWMHIGNAEE